MSLGRLGQLARIDDRWQLRFTRRLPHPPQRVWRALTEPEELRAWFPVEIQGERTAGAALRFVFPDNEGPPLDGKLLTYDPPSLLEFTWGGDTLRFELRPDGDGTVLTFLDTFPEQGRAARDAAGWHTCLDLLAQRLAGEQPAWEPGERWKRVHPAYVERFGPEAATVGPPQPPAGRA